MLGNVNNNFDALNAEGYTETEKINFNALLDKIDSDNLNQIELNKEKERIVKDNKELINNMKKMISLINNTGKALYKYTNYEKTNEYTLTKIMHRVRNAMSKDESTKEYKTFIEGVASDFVTEEPMANVKVSVEGTNVSAVTKADGSFRLALPDGGTVTIVAEIDKYSQYRDEMEITANETNLVDIEMEPIEEEIV
jgi:asparagine N-glycosylation enzyme membrane subunit Stt3